MLVLMTSLLGHFPRLSVCWAQSGLPAHLERLHLIQTNTMPARYSAAWLFIHELQHAHVASSMCVGSEAGDSALNAL